MLTMAVINTTIHDNCSKLCIMVVFMYCCLLALATKDIVANNHAEQSLGKTEVHNTDDQSDMKSDPSSQSSMAATSTKRTAETQGLAGASNQFGFSFLNHLLDASDSTPMDNVVFSPISLQTILNMLILGSTEHSGTQEEIFKILNYDTKEQSTSLTSSNLHQALHDIIEMITKSKTDPSQQQQRLSKVTLANMVLANKNKVTLNSTYENDVKNYYNAGVETFSKTTQGQKSEESVENQVNGWFKSNTNNQIDRIISQNDLSDDPVVLLMNAAHFKGRWVHSFSPKSTRRGEFFNSNGSKEGQSKMTKFMRQRGTFGYVDLRRSRDNLDEDEQVGSCALEECKSLMDKLDLQALMLPFATSTKRPEVSKNTTSAEADQDEEYDSKLSDLSMILLLPGARNGLDSLQRALLEDSEILPKIYKELDDKTKLVQVEMPKFSFETPHDANGILSKMGLKTIFTDQAQLGRMFSNLSHDSSAKVDKIIHKAKISVDETGAEAAAATIAMVSVRTYPPPALPTFLANRPFLFIIRHNPTNMPLFMGRVSKL